MTRKTKSNIEQSQFTLHAGLKDSEIRSLVQQGVPIECFEANPKNSVGQQEKAIKELKRFVTKVADDRKRMSITVRSKLVDSGTPRKSAPVTTPPAPVINFAEIELRLVKAGIDFELAGKAAMASVEELKELNYKVIGNALGLKGNFGAQRLYDELRG